MGQILTCYGHRHLKDIQKLESDVGTKASQLEQSLQDIEHKIQVLHDEWVKFRSTHDCSSLESRLSRLNLQFKTLQQQLKTIQDAAITELPPEDDTSSWEQL